MSDQTEVLLYDLDPAIQGQAIELINWLRSQGVPLVITSGRRSYAEQLFLYAKGRTLPGPVVTNTVNSKHVQGLAFDVDVQGMARSALPQWFLDYLGEVGEALDLNWGGRWRSPYDPGHFEL